jgi:hypothetical protein
MPYIWQDNDVRLEHKGVTVYWAYDNDCVDDPMTFKFCLDPYTSYEESIDIRSWQGYDDKDAEDVFREWDGWFKFVNSRIKMAIDAGDLTQDGASWWLNF